MPDEKTYIMDRTKVQYWLEEIRSCEERKKQEMIKRNAYPHLIKYYEGEQFTKDANQRLAIQNDYFPNTNALRAELVYQYPELIVEPTKPDAEENAPTMKGALTYGFKKLDGLTENKLALFDMMYAGICGVEVNHKVEKAPEVKPVEEDKNFIQKGIDFIKDKLTTKQEFEEDIAQKTPTQEERFSEDASYIRRWSPLDFGIDYRADRIKDIRYLYKIIRMTKAEFDVKYPDFASKVTGGEVVPYSQHARDEDKKTITIYEIQWRQKGNKYVTFCITPGYVYSELDYFDRTYKTNGFNLKIGTLDEYGVLYPISRAKVNKQIQDDKNNYTTFMMEVAERNIPKRGYNKKNVKEDGIEGLRSNKVNDLVPIEGGAENVFPISSTNVSAENKELLAIFEKKKEELWSVSSTRLQGQGNAEFMGELEIQEAGFQTRRIDIQEGLRNLIRQELDTLKDIIVQFWDDEYFFKITGKGKPVWYASQTVLNPITGQPMVINPLTDILTMDYEVDLDIISAMKPNAEKLKKQDVDYLTWLTSPGMLQFLASRGLTVNPDMIKNTAPKFGYQADTLFIELQPPMMPQGQIPQQIPQEGVINNAIV